MRNFQQIQDARMTRRPIARVRFQEWLQLTIAEKHALGYSDAAIIARNSQIAARCRQIVAEREERIARMEEYRKKGGIDGTI